MLLWTWNTITMTITIIYFINIILLYIVIFFTQPLPFCCPPGCDVTALWRPPPSPLPSSSPLSPPHHGVEVSRKIMSHLSLYKFQPVGSDLWQGLLLLFSTEIIIFFIQFWAIILIGPGCYVECMGKCWHKLGNWTYVETFSITTIEGLF